MPYLTGVSVLLEQWATLQKMRGALHKLPPHSRLHALKGGHTSLVWSIWVHVGVQTLTVWLGVQTVVGQYLVFRDSVLTLCMTQVVA